MNLTATGSSDAASGDGLDRRLHSVVRAASDAFVGMDGAGRITDWNPQAEATFGWSRDEAIGRNLADTIIPPSRRRAHQAGLARFLDTGETHILDRRVEMTAINRDGREFPVALTAWAVGEGAGATVLNAFVHDLSELRAYQDALRASEDRYRVAATQLAAAQRAAGIGVWVWDAVSRTSFWSDELFHIYGLEPGEAPSMEHYLTMVHPDDRAMVQAAAQHSIDTGEPQCYDHRVMLPDGRVRIVRTRADVVLGESGTAIEMVGTAQDVTDDVRTTQALRVSESRLAEAEGTGLSGIWQWDLVTDQVTWSAEVSRLLGVDGADASTSFQGYLGRVHPADRARVGSALRAAVVAREEAAVDHRVVRPDGTVAWIHCRGQVEVDAEGAPTRMSGTAVDITTRELAALALSDELTGLQNRRGFVILADHQFRVAARVGRPIPLLFIDVNSMKAVNDTYGHDEGDQALIEVAQYLRSSVRASDLVARVGGDEFCVLLVDEGNGSRTGVTRVMTKLRPGPSRAERPYPLALSVGVAWLEPGSGTSVEDLMRRADGAMYVDKSSRAAVPRVLVVEDDADLRALFELSLRSRYDVVAVGTGSAALDEAAEHVPDLMLLDLHLPDMHGTEVLRRLRSSPGREVSVIVMTGTNGLDAELDSLRKGADDFVVKPIDLDILMVRMENVLHGSSSRSRRMGS